MGMWDELKKRAKILKCEVMTLSFALGHPRTPWHAKALALVVTAYAFSPIDFIPDFIPIIGLLDDLILLPLGIWAACALIPPEVLEECREKARGAEQEKKPVNLVAAAVIILIWIMAALLVYHLITLERRHADGRS
ncbi:MAG: DUF1232 domain-containing protein [Candidatus Eremiobacteraeota bacterium]|nr:DUF1232 domain-containing protein [Candidatus Eremiobacteraeota bacterium]